jgi:hypothetical protein
VLRSLQTNRRVHRWTAEIIAIVALSACGAGVPREHYFITTKGGALRGLPRAHDGYAARAADAGAEPAPAR